MFHDWHCVAAPILAASGEVLGIVNIARSLASDVRDEPALARLLADKLGGRLAEAHEPMAQQLAISPTQQTILASLKRGLTCKEIALDLNVSTRTVESHLEKLRKRFEAKTTVHLVALLADAVRLWGEPG